MQLCGWLTEEDGNSLKIISIHKHKLSLAKEKYYETHVNIPVNKGNS